MLWIEFEFLFFENKNRNAPAFKYQKSVKDFKHLGHENEAYKT
jgi:hypothetical protein